MKCIVDREQMAQIDEYTMKAVGIPSMVLMERAAFSVFEQIKTRLKKDSKVLIVVEGGNNGADGLALARMLFLEKIQADVYYIHALKKESNEFMLQSRILKNMGIEIKEEMDEKKSYDMIVDGIFGNKTKVAVTKFQKDKKLVVDGIVGQHTWRKLLGL